MPRVDFEALPDEARLWVFGAGRRLEPGEARTLLDRVDTFLDGWAAHGAPLTSAREWREDTFLLVAVDERTAPPSGCSIDVLVRELKDLEARLGVSLVDHHSIWYRERGEIRRSARPAFRALAEAGAVGPATVVFDNSVTRMGQLRSGQWERPARDAWHGAAFFRASA